jgi:uncharacterized protein DUF6262
MPRPERNTTGLTDAAEQRHDRALDRAHHAIRRLERTGDPISFQAVAREAGVSRQFLYTVDELRREIERLRAAHLANDHTAIPVTQRASEASLKARNQMLLDENRRLKGEIAGLRDELAGAWGELRALRRTSSQTGPKGSVTT